LGIKLDYFEVEDSEIGEYFVSMVLRNRLNNFRWELVSIYGPAQHEASADFISELSRKCLYTSLHILIRGRGGGEIST
jgi:hypothetical protein